MPSDAAYLFRLVPSLAAGCVGFYEAASLELDDGDPVPSWPDLSGAGNDMVNADAATQPLYYAAAIGDMPALGGLASGGVTHLSLADAAVPPLIGDVTVAYVRYVAEAPYATFAYKGAPGGTLSFNFAVQQIGRWGAVAPAAHYLYLEVAQVELVVRRVMQLGNAPGVGGIWDALGVERLVSGYGVDVDGAPNIAPPDPFTTIFQPGEGERLALLAMWSRVLSAAEIVSLRGYLITAYPP